MYQKVIKTLLIIGALTSYGCDDPDPSTDSKIEEEAEKSAVEMQVVGSLIEGMIVCQDLNSCKQTDTNGMVGFDTFGNYAFRINDINISTLTIDSNRTIVSPYTLFDTNETLAHNFLLLLHAFDKGSDISDEKISLTFSSYIPTITNIKTFITENSEDGDIVYSVNEHNITIDTEDNSIDRDNIDFTIDVPTKEAYNKLDNVSKFIAIANDKNVTLGSVSTKYLLKSTTLTSFSLGNRYSFNAFAKGEEVVVEIYDSSSNTTDSAKLIDSDDNHTLITNLISIVVE